MSARFPIKNGVLQSDLDCAHYKLLNLDATSTKTPAELGVDKEVWITIRTDGVLGTGTLSDPFDGSTQARFDAVMATYFASNTTNIMFHVGVGTFSCKGLWSGNWALLTGWHFRGAGRKLTTIYQVAGTQAQALPMFDSWNVTSPNCSIEDLKIDCAYFRSHLAIAPDTGVAYTSGTRFEAITLRGADMTVRNVDVVGVGSDATESFGILIFDSDSDSAIPDNALIENCTVTACGPHTTFGGIANGRATLAKNGRIIACRADGLSVFTGPPAGFVDSHLLFNTITDCDIAIFNDTYSLNNCLIQGNIIEGGGIGLLNTAANVTFSHVKIIDNIITCSENNNTGVQISGLPASSSADDIEIRGNTIYKSGSPASTRAIALDATGSGGISNIRVINNTVDPTLGASTFTGITALTFTGNRTPAGARIAAMPDTTTVGMALMDLANPSAITFPRVNADNSVTLRSAANYKTDLGISSTGTANALQTLTAKSIDAAADPTDAQVLTYSSGSGKWGPATVAGGAGGTVTSVSVVSANNFTGSVATATSTPAITLTYTPPTAYARLVAATTAITSTANAYTINWNTTTSWTHTLTENVTYTFSNDTDSWDIVIRILNSASNYTVTWPGGIKWQGGTAPTMTLGAKYDVYTFIKQGAVIAGAAVQNLS